jgi:hypothetical protein
MRPLSITSIVASGCFACMRRLAIAGLIAASTLATFVIVASAQTARAPWWPPIVSPPGVTACPPLQPPCPVVKESYSDIPWHQKLGTYTGNELDEALVLPFAALPAENQRWCGSIYNEARCMIETGINSIVTVDRTDTLYDYANSPAIQGAKRCGAPTPNAGSCTKTITLCQDPSLPGSVPCIEVNLALSMYWSRGNNVLIPRPYGNENKAPVYDSGLVFTDGTTYAPQVPWYMSHYCFSALSGQAPNTICDDDYFTTINNGFNVTQGGDGNNDNWPNTNAPWSVYPNEFSQVGPPALRPNHCAQTDPKGNPLTTCTLVLAGFDLYPVRGAQGYDGQYQLNNLDLFNDGVNGAGKLGWFNNALKNFPTDLGPKDIQHHFPWLDTQLSWANQVYPQAILNPFLGQYAFTTPGGLTHADHFLYPRKCTLDDL